MKGTEKFKETIQEYLEKRAKEDELFAASYAKEGKSIEECCDFIINEVRKSGKNGFADEEIFGLAVHYYDEDDIGEIKSQSCNVVVNHVIELTDEEKAEARKKAKQQLMREQVEAMRKKPKTQPAKKDVPVMQDLFGAL